VEVVCIGGAGLEDPAGLATRRYGARPGTAYLLRPDQHVCARWHAPGEAGVRAALEKACGLTARPSPAGLIPQPC
ncbi:MAG: hypothetical protein M3Y67_07670, partial [Pseudomonadota bacterium]|nr:hypothetical protein [Pseudomonadota bacterium]